MPALNIWTGALALFVGRTDEIDTASFASVPYHIDAQGIARIIASRGQTCGYSGDGGPATAASLSSPFDVAVDAAGNLFIADYGNSRIRRVDASTGTITTVAGNGCCFGGDGGLATSALLNSPYGVAVDAATGTNCWATTRT